MILFDSQRLVKWKINHVHLPIAVVPPADDSAWQSRLGGKKAAEGRYRCDPYPLGMSLVHFARTSLYVILSILTRRGRNQRERDKRLTPELNRLLLISSHPTCTTAISLPSLFRGREIACSETTKLCCCRADQSCRQMNGDLAPSLKRPYTLLIIISTP